MKIAFLASTFLPTIGGAEVLMHNLAIHLQKMGHEVHVITWWGNWLKVRGKLPYPVHPLLPRSYTEKDRFMLEKQGVVKSWIARQVLLYQRLYSFDLFQIHYALPLGILCAHALIDAKIPVLMRCAGWDLLHDASIHYGARCNTTLEPLLLDSIRACHHLTANSRMMRQEYLDIGIPADKITQIPNGVDVAGIISTGKTERNLRQEHNIPPEAPLLLSVGRNAPYKGFHYIPSILRILQKQGCYPYWVVVGEDVEALTALAEEKSVSSQLVPVSPIGMDSGTGWNACLSHLPSDDLIQWYRAADIYVHPGILETFGNVVLEAMAAGMPVITTEGTGAAEYVSKAQCGLVAKTHDVQDIANKIWQLLDNSPLRETMAHRAVTGATECDWPMIAKKYERVYQRAMRRMFIE